MKSARIKTTSPLIATREQAERLLGEIAGLTITRNAIANNLDADIKLARDKAEPQITALNQQLKEKTELLRGWAEANPEEFGKRKSIVFAHGVLGFRTGTHKLKTLTRHTWDTVLARLRAVGWGAAYVRVKEETDKERIIADFNQDLLSDGELTAIGVRVVQDEAFFVEPKLEEDAKAA